MAASSASEIAVKSRQVTYPQVTYPQAVVPFRASTSRTPRRREPGRNYPVCALDPGPALRTARDDMAVAGSVHGRTGPELFDLLLQHQLFTFQFDDLEVVAGGAHAFMFDFFFERLMAAHKLFEMALH